MQKQLIISVGREFGSGGHEIAQKLSDHYGIELLDHNLLDEIAKERNLDMEHLKGFDEKRKKPIISRTVKGLSSSPEENIALLQFDYLKRKAEKGESFVIVGRCSEKILKEYEGLISIFILGDKACKVKRVMKLYDLSENSAIKLCSEKDKRRKWYHNRFCDAKWGDSRNYDISMNSSRLGVDETVNFLIDYIDKRRQG